ncbi:hypothetical protein INT43_002600 [Umbelopsis isabellina]|uniref:Protein kinase domain-containing protein n=1 Tax=Mortierella isabellina TaxID=91625 RepID=A0A8H7Q4W5_MORIS|nr:hypothetical protein INT43_002600 [Umbelopsis isabellina]
MTWPDIATTQGQPSPDPSGKEVDGPSAQIPTPSQTPPPTSKERRHSVLGHATRRSFGGSDALNLLRLPSHHNQNSKDSAVITPAQQESHTFNNIDDFEIKNPIGYGSSAVVYGAIYKPLNKRVAIKMIDLDLFERNQIDELRRETALMALSKHPNVLRVYGSFVQGSKLYIITPYLLGGMYHVISATREMCSTICSCLDIMKTGFPEGFDEMSIATVLKQALEGLIYLHKNGHIHRDVKAGNLLMDEDGAVLLADFGVSSSLVETGERGGVRKTFVGTPCWMAPEVMDQAGYDYKADIWSFGITAIELATGHAPFAKYPPIKVLMMTLSNDPPTLVRENTKHKYSKTFKDMIDLCLNKDPTKRPTAEKLIQHLFFKQAKKKDYLAKTLLASLPALENRPHKKIPQKHPSITRTTTWDFDADELEDDQVKQSEQSEQINEDKGAESDQEIRNNEVDKTSDMEDKNGKKHITFGDVVVRNPPQPHMSPNAAAHSPPLGSSPKSNADTAVTAPKKSRFIIQETITPREPFDPLGTPPSTNSPILSTPPELASHDESNALLLGLGMTSSMTPPPSEGSMRKGRFSVNSTPRQSISGESNFAPPAEVSLNKDTTLSRINSQENIDRKSRFEIMYNQLPGSPNLPPIPNGSVIARSDIIPLSREGSLSSSAAAPSLHRESSENARVSRFSVVEKDGDGKEPQEIIRDQSRTPTSNAVHPSDTPHLPSHQHTPSIESRKVGRFELTAGIPSGYEVKSGEGTYCIKSIAHDAATSMDSLQQQVEQYVRENESIRRENEQLKKEIEKLRKTSQVSVPDSSRTNSASSSEDSQK